MSRVLESSCVVKVGRERRGVVGVKEWSGAGLAGVGRDQEGEIEEKRYAGSIGRHMPEGWREECPVAAAIGYS